MTINKTRKLTQKEYDVLIGKMFDFIRLFPKHPFVSSCFLYYNNFGVLQSSQVITLEEIFNENNLMPTQEHIKEIKKETNNENVYKNYKKIFDKSTNNSVIRLNSQHYYHNENIKTNDYDKFSGFYQSLHTKTNTAFNSVHKLLELLHKDFVEAEKIRNKINSKQKKLKVIEDANKSN